MLANQSGTNSTVRVVILQAAGRHWGHSRGDRGLDQAGAPPGSPAPGPQGGQDAAVRGDVWVPGPHTHSGMLHGLQVTWPCMTTCLANNSFACMAFKLPTQVACMAEHKGSVAFSWPPQCTAWVARWVGCLVDNKPRDLTSRQVVMT